uniref:Uncharacterized protein n=1 Tax=Anguilla anguilla TaxID=7936 RepID=A0A0E9X5B8_ANGAN
MGLDSICTGLIVDQWRAMDTNLSLAYQLRAKPVSSSQSYMRLATCLATTMITT